MDQKELFDFIHTEYRSAHETSNVIYARASFLLTAQVVLATAAIALGRHDLAGRVFERVDVFLFHGFIVAAFVFLAIGVFRMVQSVNPRKYEKLKDFAAWREWIRAIEAQPDDENPGKKQNKAEKQREGFLLRLIEATDKANEYNEQRLGQLARSIRATALALAMLAGEALFALVLAMQGV